MFSKSRQALGWLQNVLVMRAGQLPTRVGVETRARHGLSPILEQ